MLATGHENLMVIPVSIGAVANIIGNAILIPHYSEYGAAFASVFSEIIVMAVYITLSSNHFKLVGVFESIWKTVVSCTVMGVYLLSIARLNFNGWIVAVLQIVGAVAVYGLLLLILKEDIVSKYFRKGIETVRKRYS